MSEQLDTSAGPVFGRLVDRPARDAWAHEAHAFTPWLADNLDRLEEAVGIPLELRGREVGVGRYSADILATNPTDGTVVLIENQLEASDHTHLGQILTYLAGTDAEVVVWLAPQFREEHLSAIRWLNQHSAERYSFFAVRLRVVQIAGSPLAPLFEVVEKPNSWDRSLQHRVGAATRTPEQSADAQRRQTFWDVYANIDPTVLEDQRIAKGSVRWRAVPEAGVVVSRYLSKNNLGLFVRGPRGQDGAAIFPMLEPHRAALETATGVPLGDRSYPLLQKRPLGSDPDADACWLIAETDRYVRALRHMLIIESS